MKEINFKDAQELHKKYPNTFGCPSQEELNDLVINDFVKVCTHGERFWVILTNIDEDELTGTVNNDLVNTDEHGLELDDEINFEKRHVYTIHPIE